MELHPGDPEAPRKTSLVQCVREKRPQFQPSFGLSTPDSDFQEIWKVSDEYVIAGVIARHVYTFWMLSTR